MEKRLQEKQRENENLHDAGIPSRHAIATHTDTCTHRHAIVCVCVCVRVCRIKLSTRHRVSLPTGQTIAFFQC